MNTRIQLAAIVAAAAAVVVASAQAPSKPPNRAKDAAGRGTKASAGSGEREMQFDAADWQEDNRTEIGSGHGLKLVDPDRGTTFTGEVFHYDKRKEQMDIEGHPTVDDVDHHATSERMDIDYGKPKLATMTGSVVLVLKPKKDEATSQTPHPADRASQAVTHGPSADPPPDQDSADSARSHGMTVTCDKVQDYYKKRSAILTGHLAFKQEFVDAGGIKEERAGTAEHAEYDGQKDQLVLFPPVDFHDNQGHTMHAVDKVVIGTKEGAETYSAGHVKGTLPVHDDEDDGSGAPPSAPPSTSTAPSRPGKSDTGTDGKPARS